MTNNETVDLSLSLQGIDERIKTLTAGFDAKARPPDWRITAVVKESEKLIGPHL